MTTWGQFADEGNLAAYSFTDRESDRSLLPMWKQTSLHAPALEIYGCAVRSAKMAVDPVLSADATTNALAAFAATSPQFCAGLGAGWWGRSRARRAAHDGELLVQGVAREASWQLRAGDTVSAALALRRRAAAERAAARSLDRALGSVVGHSQLPLCVPSPFLLVCAMSPLRGNSECFVALHESAPAAAATG